MSYFVVDQLEVPNYIVYGSILCLLQNAFTLVCISAHHAKTFKFPVFRCNLCCHEIICEIFIIWS